jgi:F-type H+-transporting ATPase subunit epsilon
MRLRLFLPSRVLIDRRVRKVVAEAADGSFCFLPRHVDFAAALVPGIFQYVEEGGRERFVAVDGGLLVKQGEEVRVVSGRAVPSEDLDALRRTVEDEYRNLDEQQRKARTAAARMEAGFVRRFLELEHDIR